MSSLSEKHLKTTGDASVSTPDHRVALQHSRGVAENLEEVKNIEKLLK